MGSNHSIVKLIAIGIIILYIGTGIGTAIGNSEDGSKSIKEKILSLISQIKDLVHSRNFGGTRALDWWDYNWTYSEKITIYHAKIEGDLTNFPVLISGISDGVVNNATEDGGDIVFVSQDNLTKYNHEIEYYNSITGELIAWVNITFLSADEDTVIYLYCGNDQCENQENVSGTWDSDYVGVFHMNQESGFLVDSAGTQNAQNYENPIYHQSGKIGYCVELSGYQPGSGAHDGDFFEMTNPAYIFNNDNVTIESWMNIDQNMFYDDTIVFLGKPSTTNPGPRITLRKLKRTENNGKLMMQCGQSDLSNNKALSNDDGTEVIRKWIYAAGVVDYSGNEISLFINGIKQAITDNVDDYELPSDSSVAAMGFDGMGNASTDNWNFLDGSIEEVRISNIARSPEWIKTCFNSMNDPNSFTDFGNAYTLIIYTEGYGDVIKNPDQTAYINGTIVNLTAVADTGWEFQSWSDNLTGTENPTEIIMDCNKVVTAHFVDIAPPIITDVIANPLSAPQGTEVTLECNVTDNYVLDDVRVEITYPDETTINVSMDNVIGTDQYYFTSNFFMDGSYSYFVWASDIHNNVNNSITYQFEIMLGDNVEVNISLNVGWNLITIPVENDYMASTLAENITGCELISWFDSANQTYKSYIVGGPPGFDFEIEDGYGYFVVVNENSIFSAFGLPIFDVSIQLHVGWNMIGWSHDYNTYASFLGENITGCELISWFDSANQTYKSYIVGGPPGFDFTIMPGMGIFVVVNEESIWNGEG